MANMRWSDYLNDSMGRRLGKDWQTSGATITTDGFAEQSAFFSIIEATIRWGFDKLFGDD